MSRPRTRASRPTRAPRPPSAPTQSAGTSGGAGANVPPAAQPFANAADMVGDVVEEAIDPFNQTPPSNPVAAASHYVNAAMGIIGLVEQVQNAGLAALTDPISSVMPGLPALTLGGMGLGLPHTHVHPPSTVPPAPPIPLPSIGAITAPGAIAVLIGGLPAARAGDVGLVLTCGTLGPPFEIVLGSSNTFIGGSRAARAGPDMWFHDNPVPMEALDMAMTVAGAVAAHLSAAADVINGSPGAALATELQQAAEALALALKQLRKIDPGAPPDMGAVLLGSFDVMIGGMPLPVSKSLADIVGALRGLARSASRRLRRGQDAEGGEQGGVGPRRCP